MNLLRAGLIGPPVFVAVFTIAGLIRPGYSSRESAVSDLGIGPGAWLQNANFLLFGLALLAYAIGFSQTVSRRRRLISVCIGLSALGMIGAVIFPAKAPTEILHFLCGFLLVMIGAITAAFLWVPPEPSLARYSKASAWLSLLLIVATFFALNPASPVATWNIGGLLNRVLAIVTFSWFSVSAWRLLNEPRRG